MFPNLKIVLVPMLTVSHYIDLPAKKIIEELTVTPASTQFHLLSDVFCVEHHHYTVVIHSQTQHTLL